MIKAVFFDFDLTLVNTGTIAHAIFNAFSKHANVKPTEKAFDRYMGGRVSEALDMFSKNQSDRKELFRLFLRIHDEKMNQIKVYGREILKYLKKKKIKVIIISNTSRKALKEVCRRFNLHYDFLIGDEDMPKHTEKHQAIKKALRRLKLKKDEVFYVGDHINDIKEARKAGVKIISVTTGVFSKSQLEKYKPDYLIKNLDEIKKALRRLKLRKDEVFYVGDHINDIREARKAGVKIISVTTGVFSKSQLEKYKPDYLISNLNEIKRII